MERSRRGPFASQRLPAFNLAQREVQVDMCGVGKGRGKIVKVVLAKEAVEGSWGKIYIYWECD